MVRRLPLAAWALFPAWCSKVFPAAQYIIHVWLVSLPDADAAFCAAKAAEHVVLAWSPTRCRPSPARPGCPSPPGRYAPHGLQNPLKRHFGEVSRKSSKSAQHIMRGPQLATFSRERTGIIFLLMTERGCYALFLVFLPESARGPRHLVTRLRPLPASPARHLLTRADWHGSRNLHAKMQISHCKASPCVTRSPRGTQRSAASTPNKICMGTATHCRRPKRKLLKTTKGFTWEVPQNQKEVVTQHGRRGNYSKPRGNLHGSRTLQQGLLDLCVSSLRRGHAKSSLYRSYSNGFVLDSLRGSSAPTRSVFKISCLFLRPRPWQFEI